MPTSAQTQRSRLPLSGSAAWVLAALFVLQSQALPAQDGLDDEPGSFGSVAFDLDAQRVDRAQACVVQPDGALVLAGGASDDDGEEYKIALARIGPDGIRDLSFGTNGKVVIDFTDLGYALKDAIARAVVVDSQGRLLVVGTARLATSGALRVFVLRLLDDGAIDDSFLFNGISGGWYFSTHMQAVAAAALDLDGNLWIVGPELEDFSGDWSYLRLSPNGAELTAQRISINSVSSPTALLFAPDGKTLIGGWGAAPPTFRISFLIHRLLGAATGYLSDPTFGFEGNGWAVLDYPQNASLRSMAFLPDLGLVVAGETGTLAAESVVVQRLTRNGISDGSFEEHVTFDVGDPGGDGTFGLVRMVAQSDGKVVVAARALTGDSNNFSDTGVARLLPAGGLDPSFGGAGTGKRLFGLASPPPGSGDEGIGCLVLAAGRAVVGGFREYISPDYDFAFRRLRSDLIFTDGFESGTTFFW
jgi:uncharacterized delta-60 repeat protein